jgi:hypothetical protein
VATGKIKLPGKPTQGPDGSLRVQVMPVRGLFDPLVFAGFKAQCWLAPGMTRADLERLGDPIKNPAPAMCELVLGGAFRRPTRSRRCFKKGTWCC